MKTLISILALSIAWISCRTPPQNSFTEADREMIRKTAADAVARFRELKDLDAYVNAYYADDASMLMANSEAVKGRANIRDYLKGLGEFELEFTVNEIEGNNDLAYVYGNYNLVLKSLGMKDRGKYLEVWRKQADGSWRAVYDMANTSIPLPVDAE